MRAYCISLFISSMSVYLPVYKPKVIDKGFTKQNKIYNCSLVANLICYGYTQNIMNILCYTFYPINSLCTFSPLRIIVTGKFFYMAACFLLDRSFLVMISSWFVFLTSLLSSLFWFLWATLILFLPWVGAMNMPFILFYFTDFAI